MSYPEVTTSGSRALSVDKAKEKVFPAHGQCFQLFITSCTDFYCHIKDVEMWLKLAEPSVSSLMLESLGFLILGNLVVWGVQFSSPF